MLNLSKAIQEGLKTKRAHSKNKKEDKKKVQEEKPKRKVTTSPPKPELSPPPTVDLSPETTDKLMEQAYPEEVLAPPSPKTTRKEKAESPLSLATQEIESLNLTTDEEKEVYRIGDLATLNFKDMEGCNPVMAAVKVKEAVKKSLLKRYDLEPEELEEKLEDFKKKFRGFGTHCYIHALKDKI